MGERLTDEQLRVALKAVFDASEKTMEKILEDADVSREDYALWLTEGDFVDFTVALSALAAEAEGARILKKLSEDARGGDPKAVKAYLDMLKSSAVHESSDKSEDLSEADMELDEARREVWGDGSL